MKNNKKGTLYFITGLSGAGKTTIGTLLYEHIKAKKDNVVMLDGDVMRAAFCEDLGYTLDERHEAAMRIIKTCKMLTDQNIDVVCCTISMFHTIRNWNTSNEDNYAEIYLKVPMEVLCKRDKKGIYARGENIAAFEIGLEEPISPRIIITNDGKNSPSEILEKIVKELEL